jgi:hypothetical protein
VTGAAAGGAATITLTATEARMLLDALHPLGDVGFYFPRRGGMKRYCAECRNEVWFDGERVRGHTAECVLPLRIDLEKRLRAVERGCRG